MVKLLLRFLNYCGLFIYLLWEYHQKKTLGLPAYTQGKGVENLLSEVPIDLEKIRPEDLNKEILRAAMMAELDAINMYEEMAALSKNEDLRKILLDIAKEEKIHVAMFETVLLEADEEFLQIYSDYTLARR